MSGAVRYAPPGSALAEAILPKFQSMCRSFPSWVSIDPTPPGSALAEAILPKFQSMCGSFPSWVSIDPPPRISIVRGDPSKVPKSVQILSKLSVDWPPHPQDQHWQRWSFQSMCRSFPSWVSIDPPQDQHCKRWSFQSSKICVDPFQVQCWLTPRINIVRGDPSKVPKSVWILSKLSVNQPPPQDQHWQRRSFQSSKVCVDPFQVECRSTPPGSALAEAILPKFQSMCGSFPSWVSITPPPQDQHWQRQSFQSSKVCADPFQVECQSPPPGSTLVEAILPKFQSLCGSFPSWVSIDPPRINIVRGDPSKVPKSGVDTFQVECWLTPLDQHWQRQSFQSSKVCADPFQVECQSPPPPQDQHWQRRSFQSSKVCVDPFQVECRLTPLPSLPPHLRIDNFQSWVSIDPPPLPSPPSPPKNWQLSKLSVNRPPLPSPPLPSLPT